MSRLCVTTYVLRASFVLLRASFVLASCERKASTDARHPVPNTRTATIGSVLALKTGIVLTL